MPVNYRSMKDQIHSMGESAEVRARQLHELRGRASTLLESHSQNQDALIDRIERAAALVPNLATAVPTAEPLNASYPCPALPAEGTVLAVDGSQIFPDRHGAVLFSVINLGAISMEIGTARITQHEIESRLLYEELYTESSRISQRFVSLMRDLGERELLAELVPTLKPPVITLTDGPIEVWGAREGMGVEMQIDQEFEKYLAALRKLQHLGASTAGYVDKTGSDLVIRMLEIADLPDSKLRSAGTDRPLLGLSDAGLFGEFLELHERSAVFSLRSVSSKRYTEDLALHFFYLNVGATPFGEARIARVDIPAWVANDSEQTSHIHALLIEQSTALGSGPYPYLLHRSHEIARVSFEEKGQVEQMILQELHRRGVPIGFHSAKSGAKAVAGPGRFGG